MPTARASSRPQGPPALRSGRSRLPGALCPAGLLEAPLEPLHAPAGVHELLLARVERMALGADFDVQLRLRRSSLELVPARAVHRGENVVRMNVGLHFHSG